MLRQLTRGLGWGGVACLAIVLAGCSSLGQPETTSAISGPTPAMAANGTTGEQTMQQPGSQTMAMGKAVTLADATCDQIKAEIATFNADKIPQKLADFGKANYHPTAEESIRFARYVDVSKASKDKNCAPAAMKKKKGATTAAKMPVDPATKKVASKKMGDPAAATTTAAVKAKAAAPGPDMTQPPADEGITVQVPDSSG